MTSRAGLLAVALSITACHASATVENTMPIANMQSVRTIVLRSHATARGAEYQAQQLQQAVLGKLRQRCSFDDVTLDPRKGADIALDLNVVNAQRGGGFISNPNQAHISTLLVISDGKSGELLGTARVNGESSGIVINNSSPEVDAIDTVAGSIADVFAKSGCSGPRIAQVETPPAPPPDLHPVHLPADTHPVDESRRPEADKIDEDGKQKVFVADLNGALADFKQADALVADAHYEYNECTTLGMLEKWDDAIAVCQAALAKSPPEPLRSKIVHKIDLLQHHQ